jgi:hypothetical protein
VRIEAKKAAKFVVILFLAMILIQSSINMTVFRQFSYAIHPNSRLENDRPNATSNQLLSGSENETKSWLGWLQKHWVDFSQAIGGLATAGALIFVGFQTRETRKQTRLTQQQLDQTRNEMLRAETGFLKLDLECSYETKGDEIYIVSKTVLENTSRNPIYLAHAFLLIVDQSALPTYEAAIEDVEKKIAKSSVAINVVVPVNTGKKGVIETIHEYLNRNHLLKGDKFIIVSLPYYYKLHSRVGSFAHMTTTHIQKVDRRLGNGICSIYFAVYGVDWYKKHDPSYARVVHDEVIVE